MSWREENPSNSTVASGPFSSSGLRWLLVVCGASLGVVGGEYLLNALLNPGVAWSRIGVTAHMALDVVMIAPLVGLALALGLAGARRMGMRTDDSAGLLGSIGLVAIAFVLVMLPLTASRDLAHEWFGQRYGLSLAEVQTTVVNSDLTVQEATQLCSFGALRSPSLAREAGAGGSQLLFLARIEAGFRDTLVQLAAFLPLLLIGMVSLFPRRLSSRSLAPAVELARFGLRRLRVGLIVAGTLFLIVMGSGLTGSSGEALAQGGGTPYDACTDGGPLKHYEVAAIDITMPLNRWGDHVEDAHMYALTANIPAIRAFAADLDADRTQPEGLDVTRVSYGLRKDLIQPLVLRANLGDCLEIEFTNALDGTRPASMHILGLPHTVENAGSAVGYNPDSMAAAGDTITYRIPVPRDPGAERAYYFHDHGAGRQRQNMGLFGAIAIEPEGSIYLDPETGEEMDTITGSNWEAIIVDPNLDGSDDGKSFREFVIMYHEIGDETFTNILDRDGKALPLIDELAGIYRPAARAINYRSEPFRNRLAQDAVTNGENAGHGKSLGYSSFPFGDPATPIPRSYVGEGVKTRLMHGGSEIFHVHHLHGGGDRWRRNPNADPNNDFWKGLTKVPDPNNTSIHLDSQSIGPGTSYNLEHECGAGGCQQAVGDFLYHCHIGHHYLSGMWSFWRVFGTVQDQQSDMYGYPLAVVPEIFQADNPFSDSEAPSNTPPQMGVSAGSLIGNIVDGGRMIVEDGQVTDPTSQVGVLQWITRMLPPAGQPLDNGDATVWDWTSTGSGASLQIWGPPEETVAFPGYVSEIPGQRPEVLWNPKNARYTWPLFRPQLAQRPPFTARHSGAPWLGEMMAEGRVDGLCAQNGVHPAVDVGDAVTRHYPVSSIALPIDVSPDRSDPDAQIFVLNEEEADIRSGAKPAQPLSIRSNVGDCVNITFTNKVPDGELNKHFSKNNIHSHFVQFDPQASDGVITGFSYEQSVRPYENEGRVLLRDVQAGRKFVPVTHTDRLRVGVYIGIGLGEGTCGVTPAGQPKPCTEVRQIVDIPDPRVIKLDRPLTVSHKAGEAVGVEFVRYRWYSDVDFGTVFFHTHVDFKDWDHGLFGTHIVEPKGSTYHDPVTGEEVRSGTVVDIRVDPTAGGNPVAAGVDGSFREFMLFLQNNNPVEGRFALGGGTINLRAEPWRLRQEAGDDPAYRFSSVTHGDPHTPVVKAYVGDPVVIRGMGLVERVGGVRVTGHRFHQERFSDRSDFRDATFIGISERFDVALDGGAGGTGGHPGDYLYYSTLGRDFESGAWGLLRVHDTSQSDLQTLPDRDPPAGGQGFPELGFTGGTPPSKTDGPGDACPQGVTVKEYSIAATDASIVYNDFSIPDTSAAAYQAQSEVAAEVRTPLVMRVNMGECLRIHLRNDRATNAGISLGELVYDPQRSYGAAIGLNYDSTVAPGEERTYEYFADDALELVLGIDLGNIDAVEKGLFAGVVVEPPGAEYFRPGTTDPLPDGGRGVQADIRTTDGLVTREFVALFNDQDRRIGQSAMPYNADIERFTGINYSAEPLDNRGLFTSPADVFRSDIWGDPRHVVQVPAGTPLVYRVGVPWGNQTHLPTLEGHRYLQEWRMAGSEQVFNDVMVPGMSLNMRIVGGAGGDISAPGDYLFLDRRQPFMEAGLWNILRVDDGQMARQTDRVTVEEVREVRRNGRDWVVLQGVNGIRPAGDTARWIGIYDGAPVNGACSGAVVGRGRVDPGSGRWRARVAAGSTGRELCVRSGGGGVSAVTF